MSKVEARWLAAAHFFLAAVALVLFSLSLGTLAVALVVAVSRLGAVPAPLFAGYLVQAGWQPTSMYLVR